MEFSRIPPGELFRSFLVIAGGYAAVWLSMIATLGMVAWLAYPESYRQLGEQTLTPEQMRAQLADLLPVALFWSAASAGAVVSVLMGWLIARFRSMAGTSHVIFLAVVLFVSFLQTAATAPGDVRWMPLVLVGLLPISALLGGRLAVAMNPVTETGAGD